jgi:dihydrolipoamide dehydrogenase
VSTTRVDVAVIGAGTAGLGARREAERAGASTLLIEGGPYGTTCSRVGCMPSKLLLQAADAAHDAAAAALFGIGDGAALRVDGRAVLARVRSERDRFVSFTLATVDALLPDQRMRGWARFAGPTALEVEGHGRVEARAVVLACGSAPLLPPLLAPVAAHVVTSDSVFELPELPRSIAVLGAGAIGIELGQAFHRLGVRTVIIGRSSRVGLLTDPVVLARARAIFSAELALHLEAEVLDARAEDDDSGVRLRWRTRDGGQHEESFAQVLSATGRRPNVARLDLAATGAPLDGRGVPLFDPRTMQCGDLPLFVAGDLAGDRAVMHEASDEGRIAGVNAARFPDVRAHARRAPLQIVFTDPPLAFVGARHAELAALGEDVEIGEASYDDQGRARIMGQNRGHVRVYARRRDAVLVGAELAAPRAEHTAHLLAWAVQAGLTVPQALGMPFYHPVIEEGIRGALRDVATRLGLRFPIAAGERS